MKKTKKKEKELGLIYFSYPFEGHFFVPADWREGLKKNDSDFEIRTEIIQKTLQKIDKWVKIGALGYHSPFDFVVEFVDDLTEAEYKKIAFCSSHKIVWGEEWRCGS